VLAYARVVDLEDLIVRDHGALERAIVTMSGWAPTRDQRIALDAMRLGFAAHAEAEANVLQRAMHHVPKEHIASRMLERVLSAHATQEALLWRLSRSVPNTVEWVDALDALRSSTSEHHGDERIGMLPLLRELLADDEYDRLAADYATERLRALAMMSAVVARTRSRRRSAQI